MKVLWLGRMCVLLVALQAFGASTATAPQASGKVKDEVLVYRERGQKQDDPCVTILLRRPGPDGTPVPYMAPKRHLDLEGVSVRWSTAFEAGSGIRVPVGPTQGDMRLQMGAIYRVILWDGTRLDVKIPDKVERGENAEIVVIADGAATRPAVAAPAAAAGIKGTLTDFDGEPTVKGKPKFSGWFVIYMTGDYRQRAAALTEDGKFELKGVSVGGELVVTRGSEWRLYLPSVKERELILSEKMKGSIAPNKTSQMYTIEYDVGKLAPKPVIYFIGVLASNSAKLPVVWLPIQEGSGKTEATLSAGIYCVRLLKVEKDGRVDVRLIANEFAVPDDAGKSLTLPKLEGETSKPPSQSSQ